MSETDVLNLYELVNPSDPYTFYRIGESAYARAASLRELISGEQKKGDL